MGGDIFGPCHKLNPFFLDYSLTWAENITTHGFTACLLEAVLFSGNHTAQISYLAVAKDDASVHQDYKIMLFLKVRYSPSLLAT
jgi:hypothetical protein